MKSYIFTFLILLSLFSFGQNQKTKEKEIEKPKELAIITELDRVSYGLGINIGQNIKKQGIDTLNLAILFKALEDVFSKAELKISPEKANQMIIDYVQKLKTGISENKIDVEEKRREANNFMDQNKLSNGITQLASGIQYKIIKEGTGAKPKLSDKVLIQYHGSLIDGTEFEDTGNKPVLEKMTKFARGLSEAIQLMSVGSKWKIFIPYELGFGEKGNEKQVGPFETLIYVVELQAINQ